MAAVTDSLLILAVAFGLVGVLAAGMALRAGKKARRQGNDVPLCMSRRGHHTGGCPCPLTGKGEPPPDCSFFRGKGP